MHRGLERRTTPAHTPDPAQRTKATGRIAFQNTNKAQGMSVSQHQKNNPGKTVHPPQNLPAEAS